MAENKNLVMIERTLEFQKKYRNDGKRESRMKEKKKRLWNDK
ncbi:hypothetical protein [Thermodesulfovibrio sp.]